MAIEKLPEELLMDILSRFLPKYWLSLLQNPSFIALHHNRAAQNQHCLLVKRPLHGGRDDGSGDVVLSLVPNETPVRDLDVSFMGLEIGFLQLLGACNGVVCLTRLGFNSTIVLCNPSMREFRVLPQPPSYKDYMSTLGFGFDSYTNDYKLVRFGFTNPDTWRRVDDQLSKCTI